MINIGLVVLNTVLFALVMKTFGSVPDYKSAFMTAVGLPLPLCMFGWWIGCGLALVVKRQLPYGERVGPVSAVVILVIQSLITSLCLLCLVVGP